MKVQIKKNDAYNENVPIFTILTPVYNRRATLERAINSVKSQTFKDYEHIIVDDGSAEGIDDIVEAYMKESSRPVLYIKKENGGVHTARNIGIKHARGTYLVGLDSDDEITPNALETYYKVWSSIPDEEKLQYRGIVAQCMDQNGERVGAKFPEHINDCSKEEAREMCRNTKGEHCGCNVTSIMKANPWPEPQGVKFVTEGIVWSKLGKEYKSYFINDTLRVYHTEGDDHLTSAQRTIQTCRNMVWTNSYRLNHWELFKDSDSYWRSILLYCIQRRILINNKDKYVNNWILCRRRDKLVKSLLELPCYFLAYIYIKIYKVTV